MGDPAPRDGRDAVPVPMVVLAAVAAGISLVAAVVAAAAGSAPSDFAVYLGASRTLGHGGAALYTSTFGGLDFTYPPVAALIYEPLRAFSLGGASAIWSSLLVASLVASVWVLTGVFWGRGAPASTRWFITLLAAALGVWVEPMQSTLSFGQIDLIILLLVVVDLAGALPRLPRGVLIGVAAGLKLTPLLLIVYLVATRRFAEARNAVLAFLGTVLIGFLVVPRAATSFWRHAVFDASRVTREPAWIVNSSLRGVLIRAFGNSAGVTALWLVLSIVLVVLGILVIARCEPTIGAVWAGAMVMLLACVVSPVSWDHHFVWVVVPLVALISPSTRGWPTRIVVWLALLLAFVPVEYQLWNVPTRFALANNYSLALQALGAVNVLIILVLFGYLAVVVHLGGRSVSAVNQDSKPIPV